MGLLHLLLLKAAGATMVIVLDVDDYRLKKALELGAHHTVNSGRTDAIAEVQRLTDGGSDIVIVATGRADAMLSSIKMVRSRGRIDLFGGTDLELGDTAFNLDPKPVHYNELRIIGTYGSLLNDYKKAAELITSKKISPSCLDTHYFDIDHLQDVISAAKDPKALRVVIRL
jgi:L-iditol 2-dehydrogenase